MKKGRKENLKKKIKKYVQGAFVKGRSITDNILFSSEILHYLKRKTPGKDGYPTLKVDMAKAYDRVE